MKALATAITASRGVQDANKIVATNTNGVLDSSLLGESGDTVVTLPYNPNLVIDASLGKTFRVTLGGNLTVLPQINPMDGQEIFVEFSQDAIGGRTCVLAPIAFQFGTDFTLANFVLSTAANATDFVSFKYRTSTSKWVVLKLMRGY